jgi:hypothetical protein
MGSPPTYGPSLKLGLGFASGLCALYLAKKEYLNKHLESYGMKKYRKNVGITTWAEYRKNIGI